MARTVQILGSTGTIGINTLKIIADNRNDFKVKTITGHNNYQLLAKQARELEVENVCISNEEYYKPLKDLLADTNIKVITGSDIALLNADVYDVTIVGIVGIAALNPILSAICGSAVIGLANKEAMVCAGNIINQLAKQNNCTIIPLDSEHNAIYQMLRNQNTAEVRKIILTASGGPFLRRNPAEMSAITPEEAIKHPKWEMGAKISVDCANLLNKGLEVIEACNLFNVGLNKVDVLIHPESVVHSFLEFIDSSMHAHMGVADMRIPIASALYHPEKANLTLEPLNLAKIGSLHFEEPNYEQFPLLKTAQNAFKAGQGSTIMMNVANEFAVSNFLNKKLSFNNIANVITDSLEHSNNSNEYISAQQVITESDRCLNMVKEIINSKYN